MNIFQVKQQNLAVLHGRNCQSHTLQNTCISSTKRRRLAPTLCASQPNDDPRPIKAALTAALDPPSWLQDQTFVMGSASAVLGPLLDNQHSAHGVLKYTHPSRLVLPFLVVETTWWTPLLFGVAGIIIGVGTPLLDELAAPPPGEEHNKNVPRGGREPSWGWVLLGIASFALQYWASAVLEQPLLGVCVGPLPAIDAVLCSLAIAQWAALDGSRQGLFMAALTGVAGSAVEIILIKTGLYHYAHPVVLRAVPTWICWTYFAGGPAVGNLGRKTAGIIRARLG